MLNLLLNFPSKITTQELGSRQNACIHLRYQTLVIRYNLKIQKHSRNYRRTWYTDPYSTEKATSLMEQNSTILEFVLKESVQLISLENLIMSAERIPRVSCWPFFFFFLNLIYAVRKFCISLISMNIKYKVLKWCVSSWWIKHNVTKYYNDTNLN